MEGQIYTVSEVNGFIKNVIDGIPQLSGIYIRGELSNYKIYPSGHHYFTLKDGEGALRCVMFKGSAMKLRFRPENGMQVIAYGRISVFPRDGAYQLYCSQLSPDGVGDLYVAFEQLKDKLYREGLFDEGHKKPLPRYPQRIAIVTSSAGAAIHDMIRILRRRYPIARVLLLPVRWRLRRRSWGPSATPTAGSWRTYSSPAGAAAPWRICGLSTTSGWHGPSMPRRSR